MSKRKPPEGPMSQGKALLEARRLLGPDTHVDRPKFKTITARYVRVGKFPPGKDFEVLATGQSFEEALKALRKQGYR